MTTMKYLLVLLSLLVLPATALAGETWRLRARTSAMSICGGELQPMQSPRRPFVVRPRPGGGIRIRIPREQGLRCEPIEIGRDGEMRGTSTCVVTYEGQRTRFYVTGAQWRDHDDGFGLTIQLYNPDYGCTGSGFGWFLAF